MRRRTLEEVFSPNPMLPLFAAVGFHCLLFILNPTILKRGTSSFGELPPMVIKMADALPVLAPPIPKPEIKQIQKPKPKPVPKKKAGLAPRIQPKPIVSKPHPLLHKTFISKVELPKFVPQENDDLLASSSRPDLAPAAAKRMTQSAIAAPPVLHSKSRGITMDNIDFKLVDKGSLTGTNTRTVAIPIGEEQSDTPALPAAVLHNAPKGIQTPGYRFTPGEGTAELAGHDKAGYHGVIRTDHYEEGGISSAGASSKTIKGNGFEISGSVGNRKILSRKIPEYPAWAEEKGITAAVQIYFTVRPDGSIRSTLRIQRSSGYAELDQLAKDALMQWHFSPSDVNDDSVSWGEITFRFTLA